MEKSDIKTINLLAPVLAKQEAADHNCQEAWLIDDDGFVTEEALAQHGFLRKILYIQHHYQILF